MPTWTLHTEFKFDAAHYIDGYDGKCGRMHGHSYKVKMTAKSNKLNPSQYLKTPDMVCDFKELKWAAKDSEKGGFDHGVLNELISENTTAERIAEFIHNPDCSSPASPAIKPEHAVTGLSMIVS